jgi:hypothetical protein
MCFEVTMMRTLANQHRRYLIQGGRAVVTLATLGVVVIALQSLLGLPSIVAIIVGATFAGIVSSIVGRRLLPELPPWSDEERVRLPRLRPVWAPLGAAAVGLLHFVAHIPLAIAVAVVVLSISGLVITELRDRREAVRRLEALRDNAI